MLSGETGLERAGLSVTGRRDDWTADQPAQASTRQPPPHRQVRAGTGDDRQQDAVRRPCPAPPPAGLPGRRGGDSSGTTEESRDGKLNHRAGRPESLRKEVCAPGLRHGKR